MKRIKLIIYFIIAIIIFSGCYTHSYYNNFNTNIPLLKNKNELQCYAGGVGNVKKLEGYNFGLAYAFNDKFAFGTDYCYSQHFEDDGRNGQKGHYFDISLGYFDSFGSIGKINKPFIYDIYFGYGKDFQHHVYSHGVDGYIIYSDLKMDKLFARTSIGFSIEVIDLAFSLGTSRLSYYSTKTNLTFGDDLDLINQIAANKVFYLFEPTLTFQFGGDHFKIRNQITFIYPDKHDIIGYNFVFNLGLIYLFNKR